MKKIVIIGSSNTDMVVKSSKLPVPGETVLGGDFAMNPGGKGANQAVAAARLGGDVTFICKVGNDMFGKQAIALYEKEGIDISQVSTDDKCQSGVALITVDSTGENCIAVASGANGTLSPSDIDKAAGVINKADLVLMQLETPLDTVEYAAELASRNGIKVILNPAPAQTIPDKLLRSLYMIVPNTTEAELLSGKKIDSWESACNAAKIIADKGVKIVIITLGAMGALVLDNGEYHKAEVQKIDAVDTTAAGDTFCGALCVALSEGLSIMDAVTFANKASGISVSRMGAQPSIPKREELE